MNAFEAYDKACELYNHCVSRSKVCSFINELASAKLITERTADSLADILSADREAAGRVLQSIMKTLKPE